MNPCPAATSSILFEITSVLNRGGWVGVDLFFVLSGFLIGGLLFQEQSALGGIRYGRFLARRAWKIYPLFWLALAFVLGVKLWRGAPIDTGAAFADLFFYSSYRPGVLGVSWSLAVEEHFYVLLPLVLLLLARFSRHQARPFVWLPRVALAVALACLGLRALAYDPNSYDIFTNFNATHLRLDGLFFGVLLAYWHHEFPERFLTFAQRTRSRLALYGMLGLLPPFFLPLDCWYLRVPGFAIQWLASGALLTAAIAWQPRATPAIRFFAAIGRQSYATYLFHYWIGNVGVPLLYEATAWELTWAGYFTLYTGLSFLTGALLTRWVERPLLALRDRITPSGLPGRSNATVRPSAGITPDPVAAPLATAAS